MKSRGFTLIELLVVISIIATLASILMPVFGRAREQARKITCTSNQRQLAIAIKMYADDHDETLPDSASVWMTIDDQEILRCPTAGKNVPNAYVYSQAVAGMALGQIADDTKTLLTCDGEHRATAGTYEGILYTGEDMIKRHFGKAMCSFVDGHVDTSDRISGFTYTNDFEKPVGAEWSTVKRSTTPTGGRQFLGEFNNETVTLALTDLPAHSNLHVSFDLFIIGTWDGNASPGDIWALHVGGGPVVMNTTFSLFTPPGQNQAYPDSFPGGNNPLRTGAVENDTLGYSFGGVPMNAVYHISQTISHSTKNLELRFSASNLEAITAESWGIDNFKVSGQ